MFEVVTRVNWRLRGFTQIPACSQKFVLFSGDRFVRIMSGGQRNSSPVDELEPGEKIVRDYGGPGLVEDPGPLFLRQALDVVLASLFCTPRQQRREHV